MMRVIVRFFFDIPGIQSLTNRGDIIFDRAILQEQNMGFHQILTANWQSQLYINKIFVSFW